MNVIRVIKALLVGLTGLFIVVTLFSLLIPSTVRLSRAIVITNTSTKEIFEQVAKLPNWKHWHPVFQSDSATITFKSGTACNIAYDGLSTDLVITAADSTTVKFYLASKGEKNIDNAIGFSELPGKDAVQVEWRVMHHLRWYPWEKLNGIFLDKVTGAGYELALDQLKDYLELPPSP